jgi:hypothetical protein
MLIPLKWKKFQDKNYLNEKNTKNVHKNLSRKMFSYGAGYDSARHYPNDQEAEAGSLQFQAWPIYVVTLTKQTNKTKKMFFIGTM